MSEGEPLPPKGSVLMSASKHLARSCREVNAAFMDCKETRNIMFGCIVVFGRENGYDAVRNTLLTLGCIARWANCRLKRLHSEAPEEFNNYVKCMDYHSNNFEKCRKEQALFEAKCPE